MKLSEVPFMVPVLCTQSASSGGDAIYSSLFEVVKLATSAGGKAVYVRVTTGMLGQDTHSHHHWKAVEDLDKSYSVLDFIGSGSVHNYQG